MTAKLKTAILGATGYSGFELARILLRHPGVETPVLLQRSGESASTANLAEMYPAISGNGGYPLQPLSWPELQRQKIGLLFLATPHEVSRELVPQAIAGGMRVIDLSGAWRLREAQHRAVYGFHDTDAATAADLTQRAVYGLPELNRDQLPSAALVANPGCYATSVILALAPLLIADMVDREKGIISDSKSGVS
ncbi:MAG: N-acetyl-gamma-glutamyl-phosphate reductase, partial [Terriglobales bacterium]